MKKYLPNIITILRIIFSLILIFASVFSIPFYVIYTLAGISDIFDGFAARKLNACSKGGAILDSIADIIMCAVVIVKICFEITFPGWLIICILIILLLRIANIVVGFILHKKLVMLHTIPNKVTGLMVFIIPYLIGHFDLNYIALPVTVVAFIAAVHEGVMIIKGKIL